MCVRRLHCAVKCEYERGYFTGRKAVLYRYFSLALTLSLAIYFGFNFG